MHCSSVWISRTMKPRLCDGGRTNDLGMVIGCLCWHTVCALTVWGSLIALLLHLCQLCLGLHFVASGCFPWYVTVYSLLPLGWWCLCDSDNIFDMISVYGVLCSRCCISCVKVAAISLSAEQRLMNKSCAKFHVWVMFCVWAAICSKAAAVRCVTLMCSTW